jgi:hypothetical protein
LDTLVQPPPKPTATDPADRNRRIKAIIGAASGHVVEWYDFFVYASFAVYFSVSSSRPATRPPSC